MGSTYQAIGKDRCKGHWGSQVDQVLGTWIEGVVMGKLIEFYIPRNFRKPTKRILAFERGKVIEFRSEAKKSA